MNQVRPEITAFAEAMEKTMQKHDAEKGDSWKKLDVHNLETEFWMEVEELGCLQDDGIPITSPDAIHELLDIANMAMMLFCRSQGVSESE
ncbi:hypothetical protein FTO70_03765 [Methanosarcina sp. KYL-1]|uniref:hypothetical protein n=1 Tax=Methanosarcina sp. KYL-1 TaxID=2602068 RepID=UPI0021010A5A|nr:hypothetical protein [Methanosarcina sp. KYL-1]MCQ1534820.1 hypothetical protein [Methanosarcina sp. KYL-1]